MSVNLNLRSPKKIEDRGTGTKGGGYHPVQATLLEEIRTENPNTIERIVKIKDTTAEIRGVPDPTVQGGTLQVLAQKRRKN